MLLSQHQMDPSVLHWEAILHLGRYLAGTIQYGIPISKNGGTKLNAFADSSFSDQQVNFHSTTGYLVTIGNTIISWVSKRQKIVALSSAEAEFIAATEVVKDIMWILGVGEEIQEIIPQWRIDDKPILRIDSKACKDMIQKGSFEHGRTCHISYRMQFILEEFQKGTFGVEWIKGVDNPADLLTKSDPCLTHFCKMRDNVLTTGE